MQLYICLFRGMFRGEDIWKQSADAALSQWCYYKCSSWETAPACENSRRACLRKPNTKVRTRGSDPPRGKKKSDTALSTARQFPYICREERWHPLLKASWTVGKKKHDSWAHQGGADRHRKGWSNFVCIPTHAVWRRQSSLWHCGCFLEQQERGTLAVH